jgi:uncharacterized membrane-anchored protein YhcB (DUF1043 family)
MTDEDNRSGDWWLYLILVVVGIVIGSIISDLPSDTTKLSKEDIMVIEDKSYEQGYIRGYQDCRNGVNK